MRTLLIALTLVVAAGISTASPNPEIVSGDVNMDGIICLDDPVMILRSLFWTGEPLPCIDAADANRDSQVQLDDAIHLLTYLFRGTINPDCPISCPVDPYYPAGY